jgi:hypothetical protein
MTNSFKSEAGGAVQTGMNKPSLSVGALLEQLITAPRPMRVGLARQVLARFTAALELLARAQDGSPKRPRDANAHAVQLDYDIGRLLQREGYVWDAIGRKWRAPTSACQAHGTLYQCEWVPPVPEVDLKDLAADEAALPWNRDE